MKKLYIVLSLALLSSFSLTVYAVGTSTGSAPLQAEIADGTVCNDLGTLEERIECRLVKGEEALASEPYMPEECRAIDDEAAKSSCVDKYKSYLHCWDEAAGEQRTSCVKGVLGLPDGILAIDEVCGEKATTCRAKYTEGIYNLIKFRFYDAEERAENWYKAGRVELDDAVAFIAQVVNAKIDFNAAKDKAARKAVIQEMIDNWADLVAKVK